MAIAHHAWSCSTDAASQPRAISGMGASRRRSPSSDSNASHPLDMLGRMRNRGSTNRRRSRTPGGGPAFRCRRSASVGCTSQTAHDRPRSSVNSRSAIRLTRRQERGERVVKSRAEREQPRITLSLAVEPIDQHVHAARAAAVPLGVGQGGLNQFPHDGEPISPAPLPPTAEA